MNWIENRKNKNIFKKYIILSGHYVHSMLDFFFWEEPYTNLPIAKRALEIKVYYLYVTVWKAMETTS